MRENHARSFASCTNAVFYGVVRESDHLMKPEDYVPLDAFRLKCGFEKLTGMMTNSWKVAGATEKAEKLM